MSPRRMLAGILLFGILLDPGMGGLQGASLESREQSLYEEGLALNELRRFNEALMKFKEAIALDPDVHKYHNAVFVTYMSTRRGLEGLAFYEDYAAKFPDNATVHYWLGRYHLQSGALEKAAETFEKAVRFNPGDEHPWISLGHVQLRLGRYDAALKAYQEADRLVPGIAIVRAGIGKIHFQRGDDRKARAEYESALKKDPGLMEARFELSLIYEKQGEFGRAIAEWKRILESDPNDLRAREKLARTYFRGEQYADAVREFSLLSRLLPNDPDVYLGLGEAQVMLASTLGDVVAKERLISQATDSFQHALDFDPENETARKYLASLSAK